MVKSIIGVLTLVGLTLVFFFFFVGAPRVSREQQLFLSPPYVYGNPGQSIEDIEIVALYFVPKDRQDAQISGWFELLLGSLQELQKFHELQFLGRSQIGYRIYPEPVIGEEGHATYDIPDLDHANPERLSALQREVAARIDKNTTTGNAYRVFVVMYEGIGATGADQIALLSRVFFTEEKYQPLTDTFLAHEFYHALSVPDHYQRSAKVFDDGQLVSVEILSSEDLMGRVRVPLEKTYLDKSTRKQMGL